jgi:hypothetical protein
VHHFVGGILLESEGVYTHDVRCLDGRASGVVGQYLGEEEVSMRQTKVLAASTGTYFVCRSWGLLLPCQRRNSCSMPVSGSVRVQHCGCKMGGHYWEHDDINPVMRLLFIRAMMRLLMKNDFRKLASSNAASLQLA